MILLGRPNLLQRLGTAGQLLSEGDFQGVIRRVRALITRTPVPLGEGLTPHPRAPRAHARAAQTATLPIRLVMGTSSLALEGAPLSQLELTLGLRDTDLFDITTLAAADGPLSARYRANGLKLMIDPRLNPATGAPSLYERDIAALADWLTSLGPDVVYANTLDRFGLIDAARLAGAPSIWNIRESEPWRLRLADRHTAVAARALACFSYPQEVIFVASSSREEWARFKGPDTRFSLVPNALRPALDTSRDGARIRAQLGCGPNDLLVLNVGTLCARKGQIDLARALSADRRLSHIRVVCVGGSFEGYGNEVLNACHPDIRGRISCVGVQGRVADYYAAADIYACTSRSEALPRTLLEAAAAGKPIITTPVGGIADHFADGVSALFYQPGDTAGLAGRLRELATNPELRTRLATAAPAALRGLSGYDLMVAEYLCALNRAAGYGDIHGPHRVATGLRRGAATLVEA